MGEKGLKIVMYPWFAMGHLTSFLHISNKLAERGHRIFFILPSKAQSKLENFNLHAELITFMPITVPQVEGLPHGAQTTADIPFHLSKHLRKAMDLTAPTIESLLRQLKPHFVFFDFTHWLPAVARALSIKSIHYCTISPASAGYLIRDESSADAFLNAPPGFPSSAIKLYRHEARGVCFINNGKEFESEMTFVQRMIMSLDECDAIAFKSCREVEGVYCDFLEKKLKKPVFLAGPVVPKAPLTSTLDETFAKWLDRFEVNSVVYCAFGSEARLVKDKFQELVLGLELTGLPFLVALKPPVGAETTEEALPIGFSERTKDRGVVHGSWVPQQLILSHPSVGCFVTHCGSGSLSEGMVSECRLVLLPHVGDQIINSRLMGGELKVGVEVEKGDEDGLFTKEGVMKAVKLVMEEGSEVGANHAKWRDFCLREGLEDSYFDHFVQNLQSLL
ncbi:hypothetical protein ACS0TY_032178 [Phlomoides rotata]